MRIFFLNLIAILAFNSQAKASQPCCGDPETAPAQALGVNSDDTQSCICHRQDNPRDAGLERPSSGIGYSVGETKDSSGEK